MQVQVPQHFVIDAATVITFVARKFTKYLTNTNGQTRWRYRAIFISCRTEDCACTYYWQGRSIIHVCYCAWCLYRVFAWLDGSMVSYWFVPRVWVWCSERQVLSFGGNGTLP